MVWFATGTAFLGSGPRLHGAWFEGMGIAVKG